MTPAKPRSLLAGTLALATLAPALSPTLSAAPVELSVHADQAKEISPDLFGLFFEDINWGADGGLYGELVQNRSFEYSAYSNPKWNNFTSWELVERGGAKGGWSLDGAVPLHENNPHALVLHTKEVGDGVGLMNPGYDGIPVTKGKQYDFSVFARLTYMGPRWGGEPFHNGEPMPMEVRIESQDGKVLAKETFEVQGDEWQKVETTLTARQTDPKARLVLLAKGQGGVALDMISLFPEDTFKGRQNGLRKDLAQTLANMQPKFIRFPGGCVAHGHNLDNMYRWKDTIGPIETRKSQFNLWGYQQSLGLGYFEYFQFCEDIGAEPLPVVPAGVTCQNAGHTKGAGQRGIPMDEMDAYVQEVLDLIEYANGPADSEWGSRRAEAGHPEPFNLKYLGVGNEDHITDVFGERFKMITDAVREQYPDITVIGTVGPFHSGPDFEDGWELARKMDLEMVDEHYYVPPEWLLDNLDRYDSYDRNGPHVYLGEYAAHEPDRANTLRSALAEAAYLTGIERNGDLVELASYAPLLGREGHTQWRPDMIYFTGTDILHTPNYYVQKLFSVNAGDTYLPSDLSAEDSALAVSVVEDSQSGDVIVKIVNPSDAAEELTLDPAQFGSFRSQAQQWVLTGEPKAVNTWEQPDTLKPEKSTVKVSGGVSLAAPANSLTVLRLKKR
ncbi:MAG: alpha-N-arabinofuranosidase [Puniceicoccaceae bacterium 5H]|nr:MAG: alpha-N-arabinofuranosidase [Puniceicoccaceae bacterium 5H]